MSIPQIKASIFEEPINGFLRCPFCLQHGVPIEKKARGTLLLAHQGCNFKQRQFFKVRDMVHVIGPHFEEDQLFQVAGLLFMENGRIKTLRLRAEAATEDETGQIVFLYDEKRHGWKYVRICPVVGTYIYVAQPECRDRRHTIKWA